MFKKLTQVLLLSVVTALCVACMAGCGKKQEAAGEDEEKYMFVPTIESFDLPTNTYPSGEIVVEDGKYKFMTSEYDEKTEESKNYFITCNPDGSDMKTVTIQEASNPNSYPLHWSADDNGGLTIYYSCFDEKSEKDNLSMAKYDGDGKMLESAILSELNDNKGADYISSIFVADDGKIIVGGDTGLYVLGSDGKYKGKINSNNWINGIIKLGDGKLCCTTYGETGMVAKEIDAEALKLGDELKDVPDGATLWHDNGDGTYYIATYEALYKYNLREQKNEEILKWTDADLFNVSPSYFEPVSEDSYRIIATNYESENITKIETVTITKILDDGSRKEIVLGSLYSDFTLEGVIRQFNTSNADYRIKTINYTDEYGEWDTAVEKFKNDIAEGKLDIVNICQLESIVGAIDTSAYEDLNTYIDKDSEINREDYYANIFDAMLDNGKLYSLSPTFTIETLGINSKYSGGKTSWNMDDVLALADKMNNNTFMGTMSSQMVLSQMAMLNTRFLDMKNGTCDFDNDDYVKLLEFASKFPAEINYDEEIDDFKDMQDEKMVLTPLFISDFDSLQVYDKAMNDNMEVIGFPTTDGTQGNVINFSIGYGIASKCQDKEGAWKFLRLLLLDDFQDMEYLNGFPIKKDCFDKVAARLKERGSSGGWSSGGVVIEIEGVRDEDIELVRNMIPTLTHTSTYNDEVMNIIYEEADPVFQSGKSPAEAASVTQSRVNLYIAEHH